MSLSTKRFRIAIAQEALGLPLKPALEAAAQAGADSLYLVASPELDPRQLGSTARREIRVLFRNHDLEFAGLKCPLKHSLDQPERLQERLDTLKAWLQLARDLGGPGISIPWPPLSAAWVAQLTTTPESPASSLILTTNADRLPLAVAPTTVAPAPIDSSALIAGQTLSQAMEFLGRAAEFLGGFVAVEVGYEPPDVLLRVLESLQQPLLQFHYDPLNFIANGHKPIAALGALGAKLGLVTLRDARGKQLSGGPQETPLGAGDLDWMTFFAVLQSLPYRGDLILDRQQGAQRASETLAGVSFVRRWLPAELSRRG